MEIKNIITVYNDLNEVVHIELIPYEFKKFDFNELFKFLENKGLDLKKSFSINFCNIDGNSEIVEYVKNIIKTSYLIEEKIYNIEKDEAENINIKEEEQNESV